MSETGGISARDHEYEMIYGRIFGLSAKIMDAVRAEALETKHAVAAIDVARAIVIAAARSDAYAAEAENG